MSTLMILNTVIQLVTAMPSMPATPSPTPSIDEAEAVRLANEKSYYEEHGRD